MGSFIRYAPKLIYQESFRLCKQKFHLHKENSKKNILLFYRLTSREAYQNKVVHVVYLNLVPFFSIFKLTIFS